MKDASTLASKHASTSRPWKRAAVWLALLGPLFYASYGFANWWAGTRGHVPSLAFDWERRIPFWPWTIFPYWTINVFYALSLFLTRTPHQVDRHAARLITATVIAVTCFVLWPLRFSFGQPAVEGAPAFLFNALRSFDQPFNQAPSLHIALAVILWDWYRRLLHARWSLVVLHVWAFAICASVLTTWQHHFIDIPTGALLGIFCVWLWPLERVVSLPGGWRLARDPRRWRLVGIYAAGAAACLATAVIAGGAALWLGWPAASLALVALCYAGLGARGFQMDAHGRMRWAARWLFAPYRFGAAVNAWAWTRKLPASVPVVPGVQLGRRPTEAEWQRAGRPCVLSLCAELPLPRLPASACTACVPMLDLVAPSAHSLRRAALVIEGWRRSEQAVWVCCALGFSRSASVVIGWLALRQRDCNLATAEAVVRQARPQIVMKRAWREALAGALTTDRSHGD
ncbi:MAG: phosphatase PAP2/dual specificity phosphatase family protein [Variovorax sp.]